MNFNKVYRSNFAMSSEYAKKVSAERIIQVTVDKATKDTLRQLAESQNRTLSNFSGTILKDFLANQKPIIARRPLTIK